MKRLILVGLLSFSLGFGARLLISRLAPMPMSAADHWRIVNAYRAYVKDPANYSLDSYGFSSTTLPPDPRPSLFALVNAGELEHVDIVFPKLPPSNENNRLWMDFANNRDGIIYVTGNPTYSYYHASGEQPLHLNLWFKPSDRSEVQDLIKQLEGRAGS